MWQIVIQRRHAYWTKKRWCHPMQPHAAMHAYAYGQSTDSLCIVMQSTRVCCMFSAWGTSQTGYHTYGCVCGTTTACMLSMYVCERVVQIKVVSQQIYLHTLSQSYIIYIYLLPTCIYIHTHIHMYMHMWL